MKKNIIINQEININEVVSNTTYFECYIFDNRNEKKIYIENVKFINCEFNKCYKIIYMFNTYLVNNRFYNSWILINGVIFNSNHKLINTLFDKF